MSPRRLVGVTSLDSGSVRMWPPMNGEAHLAGTQIGEGSPQRRGMCKPEENSRRCESFARLRRIRAVATISVSIGLRYPP